MSVKFNVYVGPMDKQYQRTELEGSITIWRLNFFI